MSDLFSKYDVPVPRYTSYPTVPFWETTPTADQWINHIESTLAAKEATWSMYLHIPFCETLCTFCGCNNIITKDHSKEDPYIELLLKEWKSYLKDLPILKQRKLKAIHLGGGSPTFIAPAKLKTLLVQILEDCQIDLSDFEGAIEVDPRRTQVEHLRQLRSIGFNRISLGVQDFDPEVQRLVNRHQPYEVTKNILDAARELGYDSINFDLIYGLAKQTEDSMRKTAELTVGLKPDRIALYSLAIVPWIKPQQRLFKDEDLPQKEEKRKLYELARNILLQAGYVEVGMDHFALPQENLALAMNQGHLHRNFMGYTDQRTELLLGLGVSAISETQESFHQNEKIFPIYQEKIQQIGRATHRGHVLSSDDKNNRKQILDLMTKFKVNLQSEKQVAEAQEFLGEMLKDGLVAIEHEQLSITDKGRPFIRNACVFFDDRLKLKQPNTQLFSKSI